MTTTIATKSDLQLLRTELHQECALICKDMEILANRIDNRIEGLSTTMTLRLGSMLLASLGFLFAALKLTD